MRAPSPPSAPPAIQVAGLCKRFGTVTAVEDVTFDIARGTTVALLGGNGAGKTTTLSMLLGLLLPSAGQVRVLGEDMIRHRYRVLARMNFSTPYVDLPHRLTVAENLNVYARLYGLADPSRQVGRIAGELDLGDFLRRRTGSLSAGQKTRVALAKALLNEPDVGGIPCCWTSRPHRWTRTRRTGCAVIWSAIRRAPARRSFSRPTIWARWSACAPSS